MRSPVAQNAPDAEGSAWTAEGRFPPFASTRDERRRWSLCHSIATTISETCEPSRVADARFVWYTERWLWASDLRTGDDESGTQQ